MNCINHPEQSRVAFCQQCGNPLCETCARHVGSAVFCEPCLQARVGPASAGPVTGATAAAMPPLSDNSASPFLAGVLGFIPGVGAMYNGQFVKAMIHIAVFAALCFLSSHEGFFVIFIAGWVFYQVFDAVFTARARRDGDPLPDPFGLLRLENEVNNRPNIRPGISANYPPYVAPVVSPASGAPGYVAPATSYIPPAVPYVPAGPPRSNVPVGAVVLIGLGVLFLMGNVNLFNIRLSHIFMPFLMIGLGVWLYCRRVFEYPAMQPENDPAAYHAQYRQHALHSLRVPAYIALTGVLWLLNTLHIIRFGHALGFEIGAYLLLAGVLVLIERMAGPVEVYEMPPAPPGYSEYPEYPAYPAAPAAADTETETPLSHRNTEGQE
jgi:TM2 domain-containing membrane protein YozV